MSAIDDLKGVIELGVTNARTIGELEGENKVLREQLSKSSESEKFFRHLNNGEVYAVGNGEGSFNFQILLEENNA